VAGITGIGSKEYKKRTPMIIPRIHKGPDEGGYDEKKRNSAHHIIDEVPALAVSETKKAGFFTLPGIGKLVLVKRKARMGRSPATGATIKIPAKTVVKMRVAKAAKEAIVPGKK
jgi:DNA-binding protein HU-beta